MSELLGEAVARHAAAAPDARALVEVGVGGDREWTWSALAAATGHAAGELRSLGIAPGDTVAYQLQNRLEFVALTLAIIELGATCMPLMPIFRERELEFMLGQAQPRVLYVPDSFRGHDHLAMAQGIAQRVPSLAHVVAIPDARRGEGWPSGGSSAIDPHPPPTTRKPAPAPPAPRAPSSTSTCCSPPAPAASPRGRCTATTG